MHSHFKEGIEEINRLVFFWCRYSVECFCLRNGQREVVGAERMCLSQDKGRSGMIMLVRESWAYPNRQYGFPAHSLLSVTSNTHTYTQWLKTESSLCCRYWFSAACLWYHATGQSQVPECPWARCFTPQRTAWSLDAVSSFGDSSSLHYLGADIIIKNLFKCVQ